jgi:uncharacterized membrane protein YtjA (UPF0391 family)
MRSWIFTFFLLTIFSGLIGFTQLASMTAQFAQTIFLISGIITLITLLWYFLQKKSFILSWTLLFLAIACISGVLAYTQLTTAIIYIAKIAFYIFLVLLILTIMMRTIRKRT